MHAPNDRLRLGSQWRQGYAQRPHGRRAITEGLRVMALRNADPWDRTMQQPGTKEFSDAETVLHVRLAMREDQGRAPVMESAGYWICDMDAMGNIRGLTVCRT